jgi:hypothetical protein
VLAGNAKVTLFFSDYPANTAASANTLPSITGPFTITTSTDKVDTRVRGRLVSLKIENDALINLGDMERCDWTYNLMVEDNG